MTIDLSQLPDPDIIEALDFETIYAENKADFLTLVPDTIRDSVEATLALESEPLAIMLQHYSYRELLLRQRINEAARATMVSHAKGNDLDNVAASFGVSRLVIQEGDDTATPPVEEIKESDSVLRPRIPAAFETLSTAGPTAAYEAHVRNASGKVLDVKASSPLPSEVLVSVLSTDGDGTADADLLAVCAAALSDEDVRPVGDRVTVQSAQIVDYEIEAELFFYAGPEQEPILSAAQESMATYTANQRRIGRDVRRSAIMAALHVSGVQHVNLIKPAADIVISATQASNCTGMAIRNGGTDE